MGNELNKIFHGKKVRYLRCIRNAPPPDVVRQYPDSTTDKAYRILFSNSDSDNEETAIVRKSNKLLFNPSTGGIYSYLNGVGAQKHIIKNNSIDTTNSTQYVTGTTWTGLEFRDKNEKLIGGFQSETETTNISTSMFARNWKTDGSYVDNKITAYVSKDGLCSYVVTNPNAFRKAIGFVKEDVTFTKNATNVTNMTQAGYRYGNLIICTFNVNLKVDVSSWAEVEICSGMPKALHYAFSPAVVQPGSSVVNAHTFCMYIDSGQTSIKFKSYGGTLTGTSSWIRCQLIYITE